MAAKKAPAKKMAPAKKAAPKKSGNSGSANAAEKRMMDKKKTTSGVGTSKPLKSGAGYLKPQSLAQGANDKRVSKSKGGDLGAERAVMRQARQRNAQAAKQVAKYDWGVLNVTFRDKSGKLTNATMNAAQGAKVPKSGYLFLPKAKKNK